MDEHTTVPLAPEPVRLDLRFVGSGSEYFRIWIVNLLLTVVTLGLYYPFAKVRRLKYFHANTEIGGHPMSFHANPWKMLRGYGLVAVLVGLYSVAGRVSPVAGFVAFLILAVVWPALWHSSLRFRLANTGWLGLRGRFTGTRGGAYRALLPMFAPGALFLLVAAFSLPADGERPQTPGVLFWVVWVAFMLSFPMLLWMMKRYQHGHYAFAGEHGRFEVTLRAYNLMCLRGAGFVLLGWIAATIVVGGLVALALAVFGAPQEKPGRLLALLPLVLGAGVLIVFQASLKPWFTARMQNLVWNGTRSEHFSFDSRLRFRPLAWLGIKNWLLILATLGLYFPFAVVRTLQMRLQAMTLVSRIDPELLVSTARDREESAAGDAAGDLLGIDIGL